jgi:pimeloyl-ACP methyl ester carboxylesterase/DNA-binding CsgD family transcriptional regulator
MAPPVFSRVNQMPKSQHIRFCKSRDGTRIAYATCGSGPPLIWIGHFARHLELDWDSSVWRPWLSALTRYHTLIRYDLRGCGLSDHNVTDISSDRLTEDFEAVVEAANVEPFAFIGTAGNVAPGVNRAARHPQSVSRLVLYGCHTRGPLVRPRTPLEIEEMEIRLKAFELGWPNHNVAFRQFFAASHAPNASPEQFRSFGDLLRQTTTPNNAIRIIRSYASLDLRNQLQRVRCPTLVLHAREDPVIPFEEGRLAASLVPDARFVPLDSSNHILQETEPAWRQFVDALDQFLLAAQCPDKSMLPLDQLTTREREVLEIMVQGLDNHDIAARLRISEKTVRNHVSMVFNKLGFRTRAQAVALARDAGLGREAVR